MLVRYRIKFLAASFIAWRTIQAAPVPAHRRPSNVAATAEPQSDNTVLQRTPEVNEHRRDSVGEQGEIEIMAYSTHGWLPLACLVADSSGSSSTLELAEANGTRFTISTIPDATALPPTIDTSTLSANQSIVRLTLSAASATPLCASFAPSLVDGPTSPISLEECADNFAPTGKTQAFVYEADSTNFLTPLWYKGQDDGTDDWSSASDSASAPAQSTDPLDPLKNIIGSVLQEPASNSSVANTATISGEIGDDEVVGDEVADDAMGLVNALQAAPSNGAPTADADDEDDETDAQGKDATDDVSLDDLAGAESAADAQDAEDSSEMNVGDSASSEPKLSMNFVRKTSPVARADGASASPVLVPVSTAPYVWAFVPTSS